MHASLLMTSLLLCTLLGNASCSQTVLDIQEYIFRNAVREDIDDITTVVIDAFSPAPPWQYTMPEYEKYKEYTWHCTKAAIEENWDDVEMNNTIIKVVAIPDSGIASTGRNSRVVSIGVWSLMVQDDTISSTRETFGQIFHSDIPLCADQIRVCSMKSSRSSENEIYDCSAGLGVNKTRAVDFNRQLSAAKSHYIDEAYSKQLYLNTLATHPSWDGHGFAAQNLRWGTRYAEKIKVPLSLIATPAGYPLYRDFGFQNVKNISIETLDGWEGQSIWYEVMVYA